jgi:hypothetical protein
MAFCSAVTAASRVSGLGSSGLMPDTTAVSTMLICSGDSTSSLSAPISSHT